MSGTGISSNAVDYTPKETSQFISKASKCTGLPPLKTVRCLQMIESKSIFQADKALEVSFMHAYSISNTNFFPFSTSRINVLYLRRWLIRRKNVSVVMDLLMQFQSYYLLVQLSKVRTMVGFCLTF